MTFLGYLEGWVAKNYEQPQCWKYPTSWEAKCLLIIGSLVLMLPIIELNMTVQFYIEQNHLLMHMLLKRTLMLLGQRLLALVIFPFSFHTGGLRSTTSGVHGGCASVEPRDDVGKQSTPEVKHKYVGDENIVSPTSRLEQESVQGE